MELLLESFEQFLMLLQNMEVLCKAIRSLNTMHRKKDEVDGGRKDD